MLQVYATVLGTPSFAQTSHSVHYSNDDGVSWQQIMQSSPDGSTYIPGANVPGNKIFAMQEPVRYAPACCQRERERERDVGKLTIPFVLLWRDVGVWNHGVDASVVKVNV